MILSVSVTLARKIAPRAVPDGCTCAPDFIFKDCCDQHDRDYIAGRGTRDWVDRRFLACMRGAAQGSDHPLFWRFMASVYYAAVVVFGRFYWTGGA